MNDNAVYVLSAGLEFFFAVVSAILLTGCLFDHDRKRPANRIMIAMLAVHALMNVADACLWLWCDVPSLLTLMKILSFVSYGLGCAIFALFATLLICYIREYAAVPKWIMGCVLSLGAVMAILWVVSLFNGMYYYWDETGACRIGSLHFLSQAFGMLFLAGNIALVFAYRRALPKREVAVMILYSAIPLVSFAFVPFWDVVPPYMAATISLLLYYTAIHVEHGQRAAEQETRLARQELELASSRTAMMLTQIQPHFLYNTLTAIAQLCEKDPKRAKETTLRFSEYLRSNMDALTRTSPIPFEKELEHVKTYLAIEQVRFGAFLRVSYDVGTTDFEIPPLCLQPLVENAVKHGVGLSEDGGTVTIQTRELPGGYAVVVSDDGVGFDPAQPPRDGKAHIGIVNVRERLRSMMGADLSVESERGRGTTVRITIPKKGDLP